MIRYCLGMLLFTSVSVTDAQRILLRDSLLLHDFEGKEYSLLSSADDADFTAILFYSTECPVCLSYTDEMKIVENYLFKFNIPLVVVFCGKQDFRELKRFKKRYDFFSSWGVDESFLLARHLKALVYPEIFLVQLSTGTIKYRGKIDDRFTSPGVRRIHVRHKYFNDAVSAVLAGQPVPVPVTAPIGCFLEIPE